LIGLFCLPLPAAALNETEPNSEPQQANAIRAGEAVTGIFEDAFDYFRVTLPAAGKVTVTVSGCPAGGNVQLGVKDFGWTGWEESAGRGSVSLTFTATSPQGLIWLKPTFHGSACGSDWCIARFTPSGPYNVTKRSRNLPSLYEGNAIHPEVNYQLMVSVAPAGPSGGTPPVAGGGGGGTTTTRPPSLPPSAGGGVQPPVATGPVTTLPATPGGGGGPATLPPAAGAGGTKIFRDNHFGFAFELPAQMSSQLLADRSGYLISGPPGSGLNEVAIVVQAIAKAANPGSSAEKQLKQAKKQIKGQPGGEVVSDGDRRVAGQKAPFFVGSYRAANSKQKMADWKHMQLVLEDGANYYWVSYAAPEKFYKEHKEVFLRMLDTFSFR
jgi:hypothetical protein